MHVRLENAPPLHVVALRHVGPYMEVGMEVGAAWEQLAALAGTAGWIDPSGRFVGARHDDPATTPAAELRYDACIGVERDVATSPPVALAPLPGGTFAVTVHGKPVRRPRRDPPGDVPALAARFGPPGAPRALPRGRPGRSADEGPRSAADRALDPRRRGRPVNEARRDGPPAR